MLMLKGDFGLVSPQKKIAYGDFLKRQGGAKLEVLRYIQLYLLTQLLHLQLNVIVNNNTKAFKFYQRRGSNCLPSDT